MKKVVVHRKREGPKQHPWLFLTGSVIAAGALVAIVVYLVTGRETSERKANQLTRELVESIGQLDWQAVREKMGIPGDVDAARFESWTAKRHKILVDQEPVLLSVDVGEAKPSGEAEYEVSYSLLFHFRSTDRKSNPEGAARWRYDEASDQMSYVIDEETKEALGID